jgi:hypothetical protein
MSAGAGMDGSWWASGTSNPSVGRSSAEVGSIPTRSRQLSPVRGPLCMYRCLVRIAAVVLAASVGGAAVCEAEGGSSAQAPSTGLAYASSDTVQQDTDEESLRRIKDEMARIGGSEVPGETQWQRRKSPTVALLSSMALPGLGQLYNGRKWKTAIAAGVFTYYLGTAWLERKKAQEFLVARDAFPPGSLGWKQQNLFYEFHKENAVTYVWWSGAAWLIIALDAWIDAHLYDVRAVTPAVVRGAGGTKYVTLSVGF